MIDPTPYWEDYLRKKKIYPKLMIYWIVEAMLISMVHAAMAILAFSDKSLETAAVYFPAFAYLIFTNAWSIKLCLKDLKTELFCYRFRESF